MSIPIGDHNVTFVYKHGDATRDATFQIGFHEIVPETDPSAVVERLFDHWVASGSPGQASYCSNEWLFLGLVDSYSTSTGPVTYDAPTVQVGSITAAPMPLNCAVLVSKRTNVGGRRGRGRLFAPPIYPGEANVNGIGVIDSTYISNLSIAWNAFRVACIDDNLQPVLFHATAPFTGSNINSFVVENRIATQRRRLRK